MRRFYLRMATVLVATFSGACATGGGSTSTFTSAPEVEQGAAALVRPGDAVALKIWNEKEMSDTFAVARSGQVILPVLGAVPAAARPIGRLQDSLRVAYGEYLKNPSVEVIVLRRVGVQGEVKQPGIYMADLTMSLTDLITRAGGLTEAGDRKNLVVVRGEERMQVPRGLGLADLQSGDQVVVGARSYFRRNPVATISSVMGIVGYLVTVIVPAFKK